MSLEAVSPEQVQVFNEPAAYYDRVRCILGNGGPSVFWGGGPQQAFHFSCFPIYGFILLSSLT